MSAAAVAFAVELGPLSDLAGWLPVAERVGAVLVALRGGDGISAEDVARLRRWSRRWRRLAAGLREFYVAVAPSDEGASKALIWILDGDGSRRPPAHLYWPVRASFEAWSGAAPGIELLPRIRGVDQEQ